MASITPRGSPDNVEPIKDLLEGDKLNSAVEKEMNRVKSAIEGLQIELNHANIEQKPEIMNRIKDYTKDLESLHTFKETGERTSAKYLDAGEIARQIRELESKQVTSKENDENDGVVIDDLPWMKD